MLQKYKKTPNNAVAIRTYYLAENLGFNYIASKAGEFHPDIDPLLGLFTFQTITGRDHKIRLGREGYTWPDADRRREIHHLSGSGTGEGRDLYRHHAIDRIDEGSG
jgi:hypothetical protein